MKKLFLILILVIGLFISPSFADRNTASFAVKTSSALIKRGDWKIYRIDFIATAANGNFAIYDEILPQTEENIKTEGQEATSGNGKPYDFSNKPLEGSTGLYLVINSGSVVIQYE